MIVTILKNKFIKNFFNKIFLLLRTAHLQTELDTLYQYYPGVFFAGSYNKILFPEKVSIDKGTYLKDAYINGKGGVTIGAGIQSGENLRIYSTDHDYKNSALIPYDY